MKRKVIVLSIITAITASALFGCSNAKAVKSTEKSVNVGSLDYYRELTDKIGTIEIIDSSDLNLKKLENRKGKIIIEKCIGVVDSSNGDGKILNCVDSDCYISYKDVENYQKGDTILTYFVYNPDTNYTDDILQRFDYVIDREEN